MWVVGFFSPNASIFCQLSFQSEFESFLSYFYIFFYLKFQSESGGVGRRGGRGGRASAARRRLRFKFCSPNLWHCHLIILSFKSLSLSSYNTQWSMITLDCSDMQKQGVQAQIDRRPPRQDQGGRTLKIFLFNISIIITSVIITIITMILHQQNQGEGIS